MNQPYVVDELCIGCGICENKCPHLGTALSW
ncbi:MAG: 4Fe-4S binding protein [Syntrophotaleaceae bacterium]